MKDPAFLFYPGDYLRDTQCLSETVQVAYDRIMCEHMRNTCITATQLKFFTKKLSAEEIAELKSVLTETPQGFQIDWVVASIVKRKAYSESRRKNRNSKPDEQPTPVNTSSQSYDLHMENEIENGNISDNEKGKEGMGEKPKPVTAIVLPFESDEFIKQWAVWKDYRANQHRFNYHSPESEQAALAELGTLSFGNEATAIAIMHQSIAKGWKGFFELKTAEHGTAKPATGKGKVRYSDNFKQKIAERLQSG